MSKKILILGGSPRKGGNSDILCDEFRKGAEAVGIMRKGRVPKRCKVMKNKLLIVYYSVSNGNTKQIAERLQKAVGANIARIETVTPYSGSYNDIVKQGQREVNQGYQPVIKPLSANPADYDVIAIGTPTWWYTMAPAVLTFLNSCDWQGKTVIPFQTHGGWPGHVMKDIKTACKGAVLCHGMEVQFDSTGGSELVTSEKNIEAWIKQVSEQLSQNGVQL